MRLPFVGLVLGTCLFSSALVLSTACSGGDVRPDAGSGFTPGSSGTIEAGGSSSSGSTDAGEDALVQGDPANIEWTSTICGTNSCGIMGIRKSGFQELADVSFLVKDANGKPVSGVAVVFELESPPTGTEFLAPGGTTGVASVTVNSDAKGIATARVQSGVTLGVFTVKATVGPTLLARSPAIGIRGVTPSNRGFALQCGLKNLAAFADALPPKPLTTTCTATLIDRFNNPVGKATTINFKVEAGAIASSVQSKAFDPNGNNVDEGKATVTFSTVSNAMPFNVAPLLTPGTLSTGVESSDGNPAAAGMNQRDGLVTILAYAAGEEAFDDNNSNGQWDPGENFIDQGEPFVDANDNNQFDDGEFYADVAPTNGKYDPPNGVWDKATTVWTTTYILYSGWLAHAVVDQDPLTVPVGGIKTMKAYFSDDRWNRSQSTPSTSYTFTRTGTRGGATAQFDAALDGYGFGISRALYDANDLTVGCNAGLPRCVWVTKFQFTPAPASFLGITVNLTGAANAGTSEDQEFTFRGIVNSVYFEKKTTVHFD